MSIEPHEICFFTLGILASNAAKETGLGVTHLVRATLIASTKTRSGLKVRAGLACTMKPIA